MSSFLEEIDTTAAALDAALTQNPILASLIDGNIAPGTYVERVLAPIFHYTSESSAWLWRSSERLRAQGRHLGIAEHLAQKSREERGHEAWALRDALALGARPDAIRAAAPPSAVMAYVIYNEATCRVGSPLAILGTSYVLEYVAAHSGAKAVERLAARGGSSGVRRALRFLRAHAHDDVTHIEELRRALTSISDPREQEAVLVSAEVTAKLFPRFFTESG
ncbi:iron-containing redox enzyme family protein [Sorangium sp. So ce1151]|uniref:iron-containing redox enzyme family protein n=1 Tax=Sorangium sp. So ce1151 TaxID=3133332 RepID=UPI003F5FA9DC